MNNCGKGQAAREFREALVQAIDLPISIYQLGICGLRRRGMVEAGLLNAGGKKASEGGGKAG
jgi:hypothetical protein